jgi:N-acetyl-gamma-glutamyl-phosphate reductase
MEPIKAGVVGATGYTGAELLRLLLLHPHVDLVAVTSQSAAGKRVDWFFPNLRGYTDASFVPLTTESVMACDVVFFATPNGTAMQLTPGVLNAGSKIIDLSADFRLRDPAMWQQWYGVPHACPELLSEVVYGLPELNRNRIRDARLVANPGCYPTAVALGFLPLLEKRLVDDGHLVANGASGLSGAGRKPQITNLLCEAGENYKAYAVQAHRHTPEIEQVLRQVAGGDAALTFVPHLVPMIRGIHATLYAKLCTDMVDLQEVFEARYSNELFVDVLPADSHPETRSVRGSNHCRIAVHRPAGGSTAVVLSVIDNLGKGAAGQAVQNMNLMFGFKETAGLSDIAPLP